MTEAAAGGTARDRSAAAVIAVLALALASCTAAGPIRTADDGRTPRIAVDRSALAAVDPSERERLHLVATDLVAALAQVPELRPATATLQIAAPASPFGHALLRALEDAGFGLQRVSADQGTHYVAYAHRRGQTDAGPVEDFSVGVGEVRVARDYVTESGRVYPASPLSVSGTRHADDIVLADELFLEQGGTTAFVSGTRGADDGADIAPPRTVEVRADDARAPENRTRTLTLLDRARRRYLEADSARAVPELERYARESREVLVFDDAASARLGADNKRAVRTLARAWRPDDLIVVRACHAVDGTDDGALARAVRLEEELAGHGLPPESVWIAPCVRAGYRAAAGAAAVAAELLLYRPRG